MPHIVVQNLKQDSKKNSCLIAFEGEEDKSKSKIKKKKQSQKLKENDVVLQTEGMESQQRNELLNSQDRRQKSEHFQDKEPS